MSKKNKKNQCLLTSFTPGSMDCDSTPISPKSIYEHIASMKKNMYTSPEDWEREVIVFDNGVSNTYTLKQIDELLSN